MSRDRCTKNISTCLANKIVHFFKTYYTEFRGKFCPNRLPDSYCQTSDIRRRTLVGNKICWLLRCSWSIACRRCSNYIFILDLTPGFNGLGKDTCKTRRESFKFWYLVCLILEILRFCSLPKALGQWDMSSPVSAIWICSQQWIVLQPFTLFRKERHHTTLLRFCFAVFLQKLKHSYQLWHSFSCPNYRMLATKFCTRQLHKLTHYFQ